jgi:hypothetical protein
MVGIEHFFLYDHYSTDDFHSVLDPYIEQGIVTLIDWSEEPLYDISQAAAHNHCLTNFGATSRWMAFLDVDEFLFSPEMPSLADALKPYEPHPGVFVHWQIYGSSEHDFVPEGLVIENYTMRAPTDFERNLKGKSIVDPREATEWNSPHHFHYRDAKLAVTENFEPIHNETTYDAQDIRWTKSTVHEVSVEHLRINHYCVKSRMDFMGKKKTAMLEGRYGQKFFDRHDRNEVEDPILHRYLPDLKAALAGG